MTNFMDYVNHTYPNIVEAENIDKTELLYMLKDVYNIGFEDGENEGYNYGYNDCLDDNGLDG